MVYRDVLREDLEDERFDAFGFTSVFAVVWIRCHHCSVIFRAISRPHPEKAGAMEEALMTVRLQGWRTLLSGGSVCQSCQLHEPR